MEQVKVALAQGQSTILDSGVTPGEKVVVDGADRLRQGAQVIVSQGRQGGGAQGAGHSGGQGGGQGAAGQNSAAGAGGQAAGKHQHKEQQ
jgi:multidrug efflux system membrane fusion protein